jgi:hypothetical protein
MMIDWNISDSFLPAVARPSKGHADADELRLWLLSNGTQVKEHLTHRGAILFRGFIVRNATEFESIAETLCGEFNDYIGGNSPRTRVASHVFTSTEYAKDQPISMHNEASYMRSMPNRILFFCEKPPGQDGETPLADCRKILNHLNPALKESFQRKGVLYVNNMHAGAGLGRSWMDVFATSDQREVEERLRKDGYDFEWRAGRSLRTSSRGPGIVAHPQTRESVWINQAEQWHPSSLDPDFRDQLFSLLSEEELPHNSFFGDGSPLIESDLQEIRTAMKIEEKVFSWEQGDVLLCDNYLVMHGRRPYSGDRKVLVAMG